MEEQKKGSLFLIPNLLGESGSTPAPELALPATALAAIRGLRHFVVEGEKAAFRLLSRVLDREALAAVSVELLNEHTQAAELPRLIEPLLRGFDTGIISEAGLPCVADPGSALVALAHDRGIRVVPLTGPSSIILSLAASGLDGQRFSFLGYLPQDKNERRSALMSIERGVRADGGTRIFIETPYRNDRLFADCISVLHDDMRLCLARGITTDSELILTKTVGAWKAALPEIGKEPAVFLVGQAPGTALEKPGSRLDRPGGAGHSSRESWKKWKH